MCVIVQNFVIISQTIPDIRRFFDIFKNGDRPPCWICYEQVWTTHKYNLVVFITAQNFVGIDAVSFVICKCWYLTILAIVNVPKEDQATARGNMHKNLAKDRACGFRGDILSDRQIDTQTNALITLLRNRSLGRSKNHWDSLICHNIGLQIAQFNYRNLWLSVGRWFGEFSVLYYLSCTIVSMMLMTETYW